MPYLHLLTATGEPTPQFHLHCHQRTLTSNLLLCFLAVSRRSPEILQLLVHLRLCGRSHLEIGGLWLPEVLQRQVGDFLLGSFWLFAEGVVVVSQHCRLLN